ncbi:DUF4221 family protein [Sinomicrobium weinanense]|uniref:DUF4221 family protein n=1 Tax=Sinomicrobium weinanense TaxID=2842200 RepID=A0A926JWD4_9FLAO|nr:DUF4221 family protein [Sinomicrobium weinanense]MBC9798554.1 DUF4221 family protein [Sinomicrobium weinanense]MBU3125973.1 DUF4221 domain-containing protein [Sinomicrobium weinanense]
MKHIFFNYCFLLLVFVSCNNQQVTLPNDRKGEMHASMKLAEVGSKSFLLDNETSTKPLYIQMIKDSLGSRQLTFLNNYNNSIYFYQYNNPRFVKKITFDKDGPSGVQMPEGYYIKDPDSIYIFSRLLKVFLANSNADVLKKISLNGGNDITNRDRNWAYRYPEFYVETVSPFMDNSNELLLTGIFGGTMPDSIVDKFKYTARIDYDLSNVNYVHTYPRSIFGGNVNWGEGLFVQVFPQLHPDGKKMIYSLPMSHDLFITDINANSHKKIYAGSNFADTNKSIDKSPNKASAESILSSFVRQDMYAAIIYDKYRKVYYRVLRKAFPNAPKQTSWKEKNIAIIIMDDDFNYLGETVLGTEREWNWHNSFVTKEGLNIEYQDENNIDEVNLTFKIFIPKKI